MTPRKQELLDRLIAYLIEHGPADLSLRPMAEAIGTSARLLIFHFHSKEELLADVLGEMQARLRRSILKLQAGLDPEGDTPLLRVIWGWALAKENFGHLRLLYAMHILAIQDPRAHARYLKKNAVDWLELTMAALPPSRRDPAFATLLGAVFDGLFIEVMGTGNRRRATRALDQFIHMARQTPAASGRKR
ncbi:MAG TPA: TetR/AcrR family transcriptional regulator [Holophagaceae bacterium]|nr:TetR/AcrR family transcriptional regulator [Holophagaceae bacterium]